MNIEQLCEYLNEVGILDINNIKNYLEMFTNIIGSNCRNKSINDVYKISLFAYIRGINNSDKNLYILCSNIINSYNRYNLIKKYNFLYHFKRLLYCKILSRFKYFMISLYKKYPFKSYNSNRYHNNKKNKNKGNTYSNKFYKKNSFQSLTENNIKDQNYIITDNLFDSNINLDNKSVKLKLDIIPNINKEKNENNVNNKISPETSIKKIYKDLVPIKKCNSINNDICIKQSNINFEKYFINKKIILCNKCRPSYLEKIKNNQKDLYTYNNPSLRKNKSETKLRVKKMDYEEKTRSQNLAKIKPQLKKEINNRAKSKRDQEYYDKEKEDRLYNKLLEKSIDKKNIIDRLYREKIISIRKEERKQKEENKKNRKSPIDWDQVYLQTNDKIIKKSNNNNNNSKNKTCSYFLPNRGRVYINEENEKDIKNINKNITNKNNNNKQDKDKNKDNNIKNNINNNNNKENKANNNEEKNNNIKNENMVLINNNDNPKLSTENNNNNNQKIVEKQENELNYSINSENEDKKSMDKISKNDKDDKDEEKNNNDNNFLQESNSNSINEDEIKRKDIFNISPNGFKSKDIQNLFNKNDKISDFEKNKIKEIEGSIMISNESEEIEEKKEKKEESLKTDEKYDFNDLLCSSSNKKNNDE